MGKRDVAKIMRSIPDDALGAETIDHGHGRYARIHCVDNPIDLVSVYFYYSHSHIQHGMALCRSMEDARETAETWCKKHPPRKGQTEMNV